MRFSIRFADKIVGTLVVLALAILVVLIFMLGRNQRWFKYDFQYKTYFQSADSLTRNMEVKYKGFTIGHVRDFELAEDDRVEVIFTIFEEYRDRVVREGSLVEGISSPIPGLGNAFVFYPGRGARILDEFEIIPEVNSFEGRLVIASGLSTKTESNDSISNILNNINSLTETLSISLAGGIGSEQYPLGQILANIEELTSGLSDTDGTVMRILDGDGPVYNDLTVIINSLSKILEDVSRATHVLPAQVPVILNDLSKTLMELQDVLTAVANNPLLRGGIPERVETGPGGAGLRSLEF